MKKIFTLFVISLILIVFTSCKDNNTNPDNGERFDLTGTWLVTRTMVTYNPDFPNGYKDQQTWTFTKNGANYNLTTKDGSVMGEWKSTSVYASPHWVFDMSWYDADLASYFRIVVEIIGNEPFKGTNESYYRDPNNGMWLLLDSFSLTGTKK